MKQETIKIQLLNDTHICVKPCLPDGTPVRILAIQEIRKNGLGDISVAWGLNGHETEQISGVTYKDGYIVIPISKDMPLGVYNVHITGTYYGAVITDKRAVSDNRLAMFELVKYGNGISYDNYYTEMVIIGLPDSELERLKAEYEAKRDEYQQLVDELNRGEVATKSDLGLAPGETVAGLIKAGGGGGGGLTPEQWAQIAKEETSQKILAAVSLTAAQADEDWKNVKPA